MTTTVFKGHNAKLYLGDDVVGRVANFTVKLDNMVDPYFGIGSSTPTDIKEGVAKYTGTLERPTLNGLLLADAIGYQTGPVAGVYTLVKSDYLFPDTTITAEVMGVGAQVYDTAGQPIIKGSMVIKLNGSAWSGVENTDYVVDYANGLISFSTALVAGAWTVDYHYGRSFTLHGVLQNDQFQRTDVIITGLLFNTDTLKVDNKSSIITEGLEFTASGMYGLSTGLPAGGI